MEKVYRKWLEKEDPNFTEIGREGGEKVAEERISEFYKQIGGEAAKVGVVKSTESTEK